MQQVLSDLIHNPYFWGALIALVNVLRRWLAPGIPDYVMDAFNGLVVVIATTIAGRTVVAARNVRLSLQQGGVPHA